MDWGQLSSGVYCKMLNHNQESGERTALFKFVPSEGANPPNVCHYHSVYEEILVLEGRMTFDHRTWLGKNGYVFHPPFAVHGFNSDVPEETIFIGRSPADLDFNYPDAPETTETFYINGEIPERQVCYLNPEHERSWAPISGHDGQSIGRRLILSEDRETGEGSSLIRFKRGSHISARKNGYDVTNEGYILTGRIVAEDGTIWKEGDYWHRQPGKAVPALKAVQSTLIYSSVGPAHLQSE